LSEDRFKDYSLHPDSRIYPISISPGKELKMQESKYLKANKENLMKLLSIPILKEFEVKDLEGLLKASKIRQYKPSEIIIQEGETDSRIFFLVSGSVQISKNNETISILKRRGDLFGEMGFIRNTDRSASVYAIDNTMCLTMDSEYIMRLSGQDKIAFFYILYRGISGLLADRLNKTDDELVKAKGEINRLQKIIDEKIEM
jgi:CRP/FNR family transcriptional regulator, cyclic AMP receptor protein